MIKIVLHNFSAFQINKCEVIIYKSFSYCIVEMSALKTHNLKNTTVMTINHVVH